MTDEQLKLLFLVAEKGSFSKAEESGYVSKQAILKQINKLEEELGFPLFERGKKGVRLTEAGSHFVSGIKKLQTQKEKLIKTCRNMVVDQCIRIGNVEHQVLLDRVTNEFTMRYPEVRIVRAVHPNHSGEWRVENNIIDVGETFSIDKGPAFHYTFKPLTHVPFVAAMRIGHPLSSLSAVSLKQLTQYPLTVFPRMLNTEVINALHEAFKDRNENLIERDDVDHQVEAAFECLSSDSLLLTANPFIHSISELVKIPLDAGWTREYGIIYNEPVSPVVRKYIDLAEEIYRQ